MPKKILDELRAFVKDEQSANLAKLFEIWEKPLEKKLEIGESQAISNIRFENSTTLILTLVENKSRFREGDMICLHTGNPTEFTFVRKATIELENDGQWLVRALELDAELIRNTEGPYFADVDAMDLRLYFDKALDDIAVSKIGTDVILPLLAGQLDVGEVYSDDFDDAANFAEDNDHLNDEQAAAVGYGVAAKYLACIQGPPGTGKTKVISLIAKLLCDRGERILLTSHTHMAINNALNKIHQRGAPVIKVGTPSTIKGLSTEIKCHAAGNDWNDRPDGGYVIGATPFATCTSRLEKFEFDTVIFDEASQITIPLAVMAMRKAKRFIFVGDHKQLPPVILSKSVVDASSDSIFSTLISLNNRTSVMLTKTYRMNTQLSRWPSQQFYNFDLISEGPNKHRSFCLPSPPSSHTEELSSDKPFIFIKSPGTDTRTSNIEEAKLVSSIINAAISAGMSPADIGVVTPFRRHAKELKNELAKKIGWEKSSTIVTDTVERMQGQERELIIISLCATDQLFIKNIATFLFQPERLNVAITRPMTKLILIGPELSADFIVHNDETSTAELVTLYRSLVSFAKAS